MPVATIPIGPNERIAKRLKNLWKKHPQGSEKLCDISEDPEARPHVQVCVHDQERPSCFPSVDTDALCKQKTKSKSQGELPEQWRFALAPSTTRQKEGDIASRNLRTYLLPHIFPLFLRRYP